MSGILVVLYTYVFNLCQQPLNYLKSENSLSSLDADGLPRCAMPLGTLPFYTKYSLHCFPVLQSIAFQRIHSLLVDVFFYCLAKSRKYLLSLELCEQSVLICDNLMLEIRFLAVLANHESRSCWARV